jgi:uncharacterized membrane protein
MFEKYMPPKEALLLIVLGWYLFNLFVSNSMWASVFLGFALVFLVPGYSWVDSLIKTEDQLEKFVLAVALSISMVILSIVWMNLVFKIQITQLSVFADIAVISLIGMGWEHRNLVGLGGLNPISAPAPKGKVRKTKAKKKKSKK